MKYEIITNSATQTKKIGEKLAKKILKTKPFKTALIIGLKGDLGSGKTTFLQGFAKGLGVKEKILSPTFIIMKKFKVLGFPKQIPPRTGFYGAGGFQEFYHIDCYRLKNPKELLGLGLKEIISDSKNIVVIEWVDKIKKILPRKIILIKFKFVNKKEREIKLILFDRSFDNLVQ